MPSKTGMDDVYTFLTCDARAWPQKISKYTETFNRPGKCECNVLVSFNPSFKLLLGLKEGEHPDQALGRPLNSVPVVLSRVVYLA